jgi:outer membrane protein assembly factor BamB
MNSSNLALTAAFSLGIVSLLPAVLGADQPQWGQAWSRNMVSDERNLPESFDPKTGQNVKWMVDIGTETHATPIVAGGRVFIGTNNGHPRDPKHTGDRGVYMCFDEKDGHFLWQLVVPKRDEDVYYDWPNTGMSSPISVEGDRGYLVDNRGEVVCLDLKGFANGNDGPFRDEGAHMTPHGTNAPPHVLTPGATDADIVWTFDLMAQAGTWPHDGAHSSILIDGDYLYLNTGTGVDNTHRKIRTPNAPSLIVLNKKTGEWVARDEEKIAPKIFHATWSSPSLGRVEGHATIFFAGGDGVIYGFEPFAPNAASKGKVVALKKVFQFDPDPSGPKENVHRFTSNRREGPSNIYGMPVFDHDHLYFAGGGDVFWGKNEAWLKCVDTRHGGDVTGSAETWTFPLDKHVLATPAIFDGLVFITDTGHNIHCLDAATGKRYWTHVCNGDFWASPLVADGKIYVGTRRGDFWILAASKEKKVFGRVDFPDPISGTATAANGTVYIATMRHLYAIGKTAMPIR